MLPFCEVGKQPLQVEGDDVLCGSTIPATIEKVSPPPKAGAPLGVVAHYRQAHLRLWKLEAECIFMPSRVDCVKAFLGVVII